MTKFDIKAEAGLLKAMINTIATLVDECKVNIQKDGLFIKAVDPAHVAMIQILVKKELFNQYKIQEQGSIGLDLDKIQRILQKTNDKEIIQIKFDDDDNSLRINHGAYHRKIMAIDTTGMSEPKLPNLTLPGMIKIHYSHMKEAMKQLADISDHYVLHFTKEGFEIMAMNDEFEECRAKFGKDMLVAHDYPEKQDGDYLSLYPEEYLTNLIRKTNGISRFFTGKKPELEILQLQLGNDYPLIITAESKNVEIKYLLAPRINAE